MKRPTKKPQQQKRDTATGRTAPATESPAQLSGGDYWSREFVAESLGVTPGRISQMVGDGLITSDSNGFPKDATFIAVMKYFRGLTDVSAAKRAKLEKEIELLQIRVDREHGRVMDIADVRQAWADIVLLFRGKALGIAKKVSPRLPFAKSELEMEKLVDDEVREALTEMARAPDYARNQPTDDPVR